MGSLHQTGKIVRLGPLLVWMVGAKKNASEFDYRRFRNRRLP